MPGYSTISHSPWWANSVPSQGLSYFPTQIIHTVEDNQAAGYFHDLSCTQSCVTHFHFWFKYVPSFIQIKFHVHYFQSLRAPPPPPVSLRCAPLFSVWYTVCVSFGVSHVMWSKLRSSVPSSGLFLCVHPPQLGLTWFSWQKKYLLM